MDAAKPEWLKIRPPVNEAYHRLREEVKGLNLHTVCEEAHCPNMAECWSGGTATFMVMGDTCTRGCRFCAVKTSGKPPALNADEPRQLAEAVQRFSLKYVVITSVDRDDLPDQGAGHFAACIEEVKRQVPGILVEVLIPDFRGEEMPLQKVLEAKPHVLGHNIETVKALQGKVRDRRANYEQSLKVLENAKKKAKGIYTKSSIMLGLGERPEQVSQAMDDLRGVGVDILTLGQYLQPSARHLPVQEFVPPSQFDGYAETARKKGFLYVASGPFVRSSYRAGELFMEHVLRKEGNSER